ncbi:MAG: flagellar basal body rod protein FlgC [Candidatus Binatia bacterium]|nr:flagellar basal body rod protein FlgC [Candidatus Binatia bacterium]
MDLFEIFRVSGAGMQAQRSRMSVVAGNLANAETTRTPEGGPYRRRNVIFRATPVRERFSTFVAASAAPASVGARQPWIEIGSRRVVQEPLTVEVAGVRTSARQPKKIYDPHHPDADATGYVAYPDINTMEEMVDLLSAVRSYEANLAALNATKALIRRLLEMGRVS